MAHFTSRSFSFSLSLSVQVFALPSPHRNCSCQAPRCSPCSSITCHSLPSWYPTSRCIGTAAHSLLLDSLSSSGFLDEALPRCSSLLWFPVFFLGPLLLLAPCFRTQSLDLFSIYTQSPGGHKQSHHFKYHCLLNPLKDSHIYTTRPDPLLSFQTYPSPKPQRLYLDM